MLGGRWSDYALARLQAARGGKLISEVRAAARGALTLTPRAGPAAEHQADDAAAPAGADRVRVDGAEQGARVRDVCAAVPRRVLVHVRAVRVCARACADAARRWIYSSTLAYIVDANAGRSSTAAATNSCCRGLSGFVAVEAAVSLQVRARSLSPPHSSLAPSSLLAPSLPHSPLAR